MRTRQVSLAAVGVLFFLSAGVARAADANAYIGLITAANWTNILKGGTIPFVAVVTNAPGGDSLDWTVDNNGTAGLSLSGSGTGLASPMMGFVGGVYSNDTYGTYVVSARATGTNHTLGGPATNSPVTSTPITFIVGLASAGNGDGNGFIGADILYSLVLPGGSYAGLSAKVVSAEANANILGTEAIFLYGFNTTGSAQTISMNWRSRAASEYAYPGYATSPPILPDEYGIFSDVAAITGMGSSLFVLQMSYEPNSLQLENGHDELWYAQHETIYLAWLDPNDGFLKNAVLGNTGGENAFAGVGAWNGDANLGHWGVDVTTHTVWAVLNHTSQFAATPEPTVLAVLALGGIALVRRRRRA